MITRWLLTIYLVGSYVQLYPSIQSHENTSKYVIQWSILEKVQWPLDDIWPHICLDHMWDSTQSLCLSAIKKYTKTCGYSDQFFTSVTEMQHATCIMHTDQIHILHTEIVIAKSHFLNICFRQDKCTTLVYFTFKWFTSLQPISVPRINASQKPAVLYSTAGFINADISYQRATRLFWSAVAWTLSWYDTVVMGGVILKEME